MPTKIDDQYCPLCQQSNHCGINKTTPCWCTTTNISRELLSKVPEQLSGKACVCQQCIEKFNQATIINKS